MKTPYTGEREIYTTYIYSTYKESILQNKNEGNS